jgi:hypothetical protein
MGDFNRSVEDSLPASVGECRSIHRKAMIAKAGTCVAPSKGTGFGSLILKLVEETGPRTANGKSRWAHQFSYP